MEITRVGKKYAKHYSPAKAREACTRPPTSLCKIAVPIAKIPETKRNAILEQIEEENIHLGGRLVAIGKVRLGDIGMTSVEQDLYISGVNEEDVEWEMKNVAKIEESISERGYNESSVVLLEEMNGKACILNGNHRIQALRNLQSKGRIPDNFKIPVVILCNPAGRVSETNSRLRGGVPPEIVKARKNRAIAAKPTVTKSGKIYKATKLFDYKK